MPFNRAKPKKLTDNPIIARFLALSQNVTIESIFRSPDPTITRFKTRAKDAHLILIGNSATPSSNIIQLGYTATNNESYILQNDTKVATFHTKNIGLNAPTKISGHLLPHHTSNIYSKNAYISDSIHLQNQTITTSSNSFLFSSNIVINRLTIHCTDSNYYTTLKATSNGTIMTSYGPNHKQIKEINIAKLDTSYFSEGSNEYLTDERVISTYTRDFIDLPETSNTLLGHLNNLSTDLQTNSIGPTNIITTDYLRTSSGLIEPIGPAAIIAQQPHIYHYLKTTSNHLIPIIETTSNALDTTIATTDIYQNLNAFTDATSNIFIHTIIPDTSNVLAQHITDYHTSTSNLILNITSNILATAIIDSSNLIITTNAHHHQEASNILQTSSNILYKDLYSASNVLIDNLNISVTSVSNLLPPIVIQLTDYLHTASNALISHKIITDTYNKIIPHTDSTSNVLQQPIPITSNKFADYLNNITLENVYFQGSSNAYIKNNQYPFNNLTVSNLTTMGSILPQTDNQYDLGSSTNRFRDLYISSDSMHIGDTIVSSSPYAVSFHNTTSSELPISHTSAAIQKIKLADQTTNNFMELSYANDWIKTTLYSEQAQGIQVYKHSDDVIERPGASNLYFTAQRASAIVSSSNIISSNYSTQTSNTISHRITQLSADHISKQGIHNKFITNNNHNSHLICYSPVTTTNLAIISQVSSTVDIKTITYDLLEIHTSSTPAIVSFKLLQKTAGKDIFNFTKNISMKSTGSIGIGTVPDELAVTKNLLKLYGSIQYTNNLNIANVVVTSNTMLRLKNLRSPVQAQLNEKKTYISQTISDANTSFNIGLANFSSNINTYNHMSYTNSSNYASNMFAYMQPTITPTLAPLYPIITDLDNNMSNYVTHIITGLTAEVSTASNALLQQIAPIEEYGSNYNDISIAIQSDLHKSTSNLLEDRINYIKSTVWTATDNLSFQNNVLIGQLSKDSQDALTSLAVSGSINVTNLLNGISTHLLGFLRNLESPLQQQINNTNTNNSNYVTSTSNNLATDLSKHNYDISSSLNASNADLQQLSSASFVSLNAQLNSSSNVLASNIRDLTSRGYTQWASMQSSNIYITSNIGIGGIPSNNHKLEVHNGDINIANNGHPVKKTFDASLNPLVWYQFSEDPATQSTLLDYANAHSTTTKYNLSIPQSSGITSTQGYNLNNYLYKNAYQWLKSAYLESSDSVAIQQLLNQLHTAGRGSFHFAFRMSSNPSSQIPILFIGYSTSPYKPLVYIYSLANTLYIQIDSITAVSVQAFNINVWYIADIVFTIDALPSNSINISIYIDNNKVAAALGTYSNWFNDVTQQDLVLRIGNNPNASTPNDPAPLALQDLRIFALALSSSQLLSLQRGYDATTATTAVYQNILWNDSPQYYDGVMPLKHIVYKSGNVGIGLTRPEAKLHVGNGIYTILTSELTYFNYGTSLITPQPPYATSISAKFDSSILVTGKVAITSDQRIKKNIQDINDDSALQKILAIEPKTYSHIDDPNQNKIYGFIAQQVKEILPEAVTLHKEVIPNIYLPSLNIDPDAQEGQTVITVPTTTAIEALSIGDRILMDKEELHTIIDISHLDNDTSSITVDASISSEEPVFIYGTEVNDFNVLNKQYIYTLNVCATQTLANKIEQMKTRIANISRRK